MNIRAALDFVILCSRHPLCTCAVLLVLWMILRRRSDGSVADQGASWSRARPVLLILAAIVFAAFLSTSIWYLLHDGYASDVEAMVTSVSWWVQSGGALYHSPDADPQYSVLYGPMVYLATGFWLDLLHPSIIAAKVG